MYAPLVEALLRSGVRPTYISHVTGHGLLKLMRPSSELTYRISALPSVPPVLRFLCEAASMSDDAAYSTFNMGAGYAIYCRPGDSDSVLATAASLGYEAIVGGVVESGPRRVIIEPVGVTYESEDLRLSP